MITSSRTVLFRMTFFVILLILLQSVGCSLITHVYKYSITKVSTDAPEGVDTYLYFVAKRHNTVKIPAIYDVNHYRNPYGLHFTLWGAFEKIQSISSRIYIGDKPPIPIPLDVETLNADQKTSRNRGPQFPAGKVLSLDIDVDTASSFKVITIFTALADGKEISYTITNHYKVKLIEYKTNRFLSGLLSI